MKLIVHDLSQQQTASVIPSIDSDSVVVSDNGKINPCIGCFGCWMKTPGTCILKDGFQHLGRKLSKCDKLIIISRCIYGSYSPFVKNVWDRSISYLLPYFTTENVETHHRKRYTYTFSLDVYFYGEDISNRERDTASKLVTANCRNFGIDEYRILFHHDLQAVGEALK